MKIKYSRTKKIRPELIIELWHNIGWSKSPKKSKRNWKKVLGQTSTAISAWNGKQLVGFGRIVDDSAMAMIYDLTVRKEFQGAGIGTGIVKRLLASVKDKKKHSYIGIFTRKDNKSAVRLYKKLGFEEKSAILKLKVK